MLIKLFYASEYRHEVYSEGMAARANTFVSAIEGYISAIEGIAHADIRVRISHVDYPCLLWQPVYTKYQISHN